MKAKERKKAQKEMVKAGKRLRAKENQLEKITLAIIDQCKSEKLTVREIQIVMDRVKDKVICISHL